MKRLMSAVIVLSVLLSVCPLPAVAVLKPGLKKASDPACNTGLSGAELCAFKLLSIKADEAYIEESSYNGLTYLKIPVTVENGNDFAYEGIVHFASVNGWQVHPVFWFEIHGQLKSKEEIWLDITGTGVESVEDVEEIGICFLLNYAWYTCITDEVRLKLK